MITFTYSFVQVMGDVMHIMYSLHNGAEVLGGGGGILTFSSQNPGICPARSETLPKRSHPASLINAKQPMPDWA